MTTMLCRYCGEPAPSGVCEDHDIVEKSRTGDRQDSTVTMTFTLYEWELLCMSLCHWRYPDMDPNLSDELDALSLKVCDAPED